MIIVNSKKSSKGFKLIVKNANGNIFNHFYNQKHDSKKAWLSFVKQIKAGKWKFEETK